MRPVLHLCAAGLLASGLLAVASAAERAPAAPRFPTETAAQARVIVTFKADSATVRQRPLSARAGKAETSGAVEQRALALASAARTALTGGRAITERRQVVLASGLSSAELAQRLAAHPDIESVAIDSRKRAALVPNDEFYASRAANNVTRTGGPAAGQWYLRAPTSDVRSSINATAAWDLSTGTGVVVAVLDTGIFKAHPDLSGRLLGGYDFVGPSKSSGTYAGSVAGTGDGDGWDSDSSDPGDWISDAEDASGEFKDCGAQDSSWHGTKVAAIVGAATNNSIGMAGIAHGAQVLPVRVLGKCGGWDSDIQAGMRWAAGLAVPGVALNPNPAKVLNMSLGSAATANSCNGYTETIAQVNAAGAVVVVAAGNGNGLAVGSPANCPGAIAVGGLRHAGTKVGFSDLGPEIAISAPAGNCVNTTSGSPCLYSILTASNSGNTVPLVSGSIYTDAYGTYTVGTSFASPMVAGVAALIMSARVGITPVAVKTLLQNSARAFPSSGADNGPTDTTPVTACVAPSATEQLQCYCSTALCGAGMLDAAAAVSAAVQAPIAAITVSPSSPTANSAVTLSSAASTLAAGRVATGWSWVLLNGGGIVSGFSSSSSAATATFTPTAAGSVTVRLTVTDSAGISSSSDVAVTVAAAPVVTPSTPSTPTSDGSGGGGSLSVAWVLCLLLATLLLARQRQRRPHQRLIQRQRAIRAS